MATQIPEYFQAFTNLQTELVNIYGDIAKKADPNGFSKEFLELQTKLITATIDNITENVKAYRKALK